MVLVERYKLALRAHTERCVSFLLFMLATIHIDEKVYCIHQYAGAWRDKYIDGRSMIDPKRLTQKIIALHRLHLK